MGCFRLLQKLFYYFFFKYVFHDVVQSCCVLINFSILSRPVLIFYVSLSITDSCLRSIKKGLVVETSLALIYILPYYFHIPYYFHVPYFFNLIYHIFTDISYDVIVIFYFYLTQTNLLLFNIPTKFMINKKKTFFGGDLCVLYVML